MVTSGLATKAPVTLGLWGGVGGGKTTFLASLRTAMFRDAQGGWSIVGHEDAANEFLVDQRNVLDAGNFPPSTESVQTYRFHVVAPTGGGGVKGRALPQEKSFQLDLRDYPGTAFRDDADDAQFDELGEFLSTCAGFLYLYDPTSGANYRHFDRTMLRLVKHARDKGGAQDNRVDQFMAVCITKYDDPAVLGRLLNRALIASQSVNDVITPTVTNAREAFRVLAADMDPDLPPSMQKYFKPGRVDYFAISSIGFFNKPDDPVRVEDSCNVVETFSGPRLRSRIKPVNVLAPLDWLQRQVIK